MTYPTFSNLYLFDLNAQDSFNVNDLTENGSPTYTRGIFDHAIVFDGSVDYLTAASNSVYDVGTQNFWTFHLVKLGTTANTNHFFSKRDEGASTNPGYTALVGTSGQILVRTTDATGTSVLTNFAVGLQADRWYAIAFSWDRDGLLHIYVYDLSTGELSTNSDDVSSVQASLTNTRTYTVASQTGVGQLLNGQIDMLIPPQIGSTLSQDDFLSLIETGRMLISKRDGGDNAITAFEARNFSIQSIRGQTPADAIGDIVNDAEAAIITKFIGPQLEISLEWTLTEEEASVVFDDTSGSVTKPHHQIQYLYDTLVAHDSDQITEEYTLTLYYGNDKSFIRTGTITGIDIIKSEDQPLTLKATLGFQVGTVS